MVQAENGTMILRGLRTGREYSYSYYVSDVAAAYATFSTTGLAAAGSQTFIIAPEDCIIKDIAIHTGTTAAVAILPQVNDQNVGAQITFLQILDTLATRTFPQLAFKGGAKVAMVQA